MVSKEVEKATNQALNYLSYRSRTQFEVENYLGKKDCSDEIVKEVIKYLLEMKYIDDLQYSKDFISYGLAKRKGKRRIERELVEKGINSLIVEDAFYEAELELDEQDLGEEFKANAMLEAEKYLNKESSWDEKTIGRIGRRLASLGYDSNVVYQTLNEVRKKIRDKENEYD